MALQPVDHVTPLPAPVDAATLAPNPAARKWHGRTLLFCWLLNVAVFIAAVAWILLDPLAARLFAACLRRWNEMPTEAMIDFPKWRFAAAQAFFMFAALGLLNIIGALFLGPRKHRGLRSWLALTTLIAFWLGLITSWPEFAWAGQRWRLGRQLGQFEPVAAALRAHWPRQDAAIPALGQFTVYPHAEATTLLVIAEEAPPGRAPIAAVEHSAAGALRFHLAGDETGAWVEWHPAGSEPASFQSGLETKFILDRASPLRDGWYLTRYH